MMAKKQKEISVSEFFAKNRHLLGFDNPRKALLTTVKEAVDNSLDACEEARILPEIWVEIRETGEGRYRVEATDNGPGIVRAQIPNIFGKLLYGSKFHRLKMSRGQQGIGISAAGMYGLMTTGKPVEIVSRTSARRKAHYCSIQMDTRKNRPSVIEEKEGDWDHPHGTKVAIELAGKYLKGRQSVAEYLETCAIVNPHAAFHYKGPEGEESHWKRSTSAMPPETREIKPHPYGIELGTLIHMLHDTRSRRLKAFLQSDFSRVSPRVAASICQAADLSEKAGPARIANQEADRLYKAILAVKIMAPSADCVRPIGEESLRSGLAKVIRADFYAVCTRAPAVYRGNPFVVEAAIAYGAKGAEKTEGSEEELVRLMRFANRVPLLYQQSACAIHKAVLEISWRNYRLSQSRGALPAAPATILVHVASVWVPFTSESKEAVAHYPEIVREIKLALQDVGRKLGIFLSRRRRLEAQHKKMQYIEQYIPYIGEALDDILALGPKQRDKTVRLLKEMLEKSRLAP